MKLNGTHHRTVRLEDDGLLHLVDQPHLPHEVGFVTTRTPEQTAHAIRSMVVRGAGAIGATAAAGLAQAALLAPDDGFLTHVRQARSLLEQTRPTAWNLFAALAYVQEAIEAEAERPDLARTRAVVAAQAWADADAAACQAIGVHGALLVQDGQTWATHCNAGWLAFVDWGSALSPLYVAHRAGKKVRVHVDETRPRGQGARLTAFELRQEGVPHHVACDSSLAHWMSRGAIDAMIVGADRIAANGDVANKIGTRMAALTAREHGVPFYVAAPAATIDRGCHSGQEIPIEERDGDELAWTRGWTDDGRRARVRTVPEGTEIRNAAFDVTPAAWITGVLTEHGLFSADRDGIARAAGLHAPAVAPRP